MSVRFERRRIGERIRGESRLDFGQSRFRNLPLRKTKGEDDDEWLEETEEQVEEGSQELFKLVIDTDEVSGELLADGIEKEIAEQLEEEVGDLLEAIGQSGTVEVVAVSEEGSEESEEIEGESGDCKSKDKKNKGEGGDKKKKFNKAKAKGESEPAKKGIRTFGNRSK